MFLFVFFFFFFFSEFVFGIYLGEPGGVPIVLFDNVEGAGE